MDMLKKKALNLPYFPYFCTAQWTVMRNTSLLSNGKSYMCMFRLNV